MQAAKLTAVVNAAELRDTLQAKSMYRDHNDPSHDDEDGGTKGSA